jgi:intein-encoded DNA endonuclease-like protein
MAYESTIKERAYFLRREGLSIGAISKILKLSKSTISCWVKDIELPFHKQEKLRRNIENGLLKASIILREKKEAEQKKIDVSSKSLISKITWNRDYCRLMAAIIFWCEGEKNRLNNVKLINSDPSLVKTFLFCLRHGFELDENKFRALIHLHNYHDEEQQKKFWSSVTGIPVPNFYKSYRKNTRGIRKRQNYQGCLSVRYNDANIAKNLSSIYHTLAGNIGP